MSDLYNNLQVLIDDNVTVTVEKYATVTKLQEHYCTVKEADEETEHTNVPILDGAKLQVGDTVVIGFMNNSIYDVVCYGAVGRTVHDDTKQDLLVSGTNLKTINHQSLLGSGNITIEGGGSGGSGVVMVGSFRINDEGHLIVTLPTGTLNPYHINEQGHLIYSTNPQIGGK